VVTEPPGVQERMARTEADWQRQIAACDDATGPEREALRAALEALRREYDDADEPRREAIGQELQGLITRYEALGPAPEPEPAPHGPVPLGPEGGTARQAAAPKRRSRRKGSPAPDGGHHAPVPLGPEAGVPGEGRPDSEPRKGGGGARRAHGPLPHGAPGPDRPGPPKGARPAGPVPHGAPAGGANAAEAEAGYGPGAGPKGGTDPSRAAGRRPGWEGGLETAGRWVARARLALECYVLTKKREERLMELGVRLRQLAQGEALDSAADDAGVRTRLAQVEEVEAAIRENRERDEALRSPGSDGRAE